jgi:ribosomal protein S18 acetylase RimI-like enzyme
MEISIAELERVAALGWRAVEEARLGDWLLRAAEGFTGRANSALAVGEPGMPMAAAVEKVRAWYGERGLRAMIAVPYGREKPDLDRYLQDEGWTLRSGPATVMTARAAEIAKDAGGVEVEMLAEPDDDWLSLYHYRGGELPPIARTLLMSAPSQVFGRIRRSGVTVAVGRVAEGDGWAGLTAIEVHPDFRRRGLGAAISSALAGRAGTQAVYLQVEDTNRAARALYHRIGFRDHHGYHYRMAP